MTKPLILVLAGGTGGHVYPAMAVASELRKQGCRLIWLGLENKIEAKVAREASIDFHALSGTGIRGKSALPKVLGFIRIVRDILHLFFWLGRNRPSVAIGFGGYSSFAAGFACWLRGVPLVIQEQNARAGTSNKLLARIASSICLGYEKTISRGKEIVVTGNPVREGFQPVVLNKSKGPLRILVLGGSLGARSINLAVAEAVVNLDIPYGLHLVHQCGANNYESTKQVYNEAEIGDDQNIDVDLQAFLDPVMAYYSDCDLVICRAGAMTLAELAVCRLPALLIPYPYAIDDHQTANARAHLSTGGGWFLADQDCNVEAIGKWLRYWLQQKPKEARKEIMGYSQSLESIANPKAAKNVADTVMKRVVL